MNLDKYNPIKRAQKWWRENKKMVLHLSLFFLGLGIIGLFVFNKVEGKDRVVYGTSSTNVHRHKADCERKGGKFNECGVGCENNPCDKVAAVCYYTCELK